jgi:aryl-alcohol dehydrogenase-like predicted oxidoreductase
MTSVVIGASRTSQIEAAVAALAHLEFSEGELAAISGMVED